MVKVREQIKHLESMLSGMVITDEKGLNEKTGNSVSLKLRQLEFAPEIVSSLKPAYDGLSQDRGLVAFIKAFSNRIACEEIQEDLGDMMQDKLDRLAKTEVRLNISEYL